ASYAARLKGSASILAASRIRLSLYRSTIDLNAFTPVLRHTSAEAWSLASRAESQKDAASRITAAATNQLCPRRTDGTTATTGVRVWVSNNNRNHASQSSQTAVASSFLLEPCNQLKKPSAVGGEPARA